MEVVWSGLPNPPGPEPLKMLRRCCTQCAGDLDFLAVCLPWPVLRWRRRGAGGGEASVGDTASAPRDALPLEPGQGRATWCRECLAPGALWLFLGFKAPARNRGRTGEPRCKIAAVVPFLPPSCILTLGGFSHPEMESISHLHAFPRAAGRNHRKPGGLNNRISSLIILDTGGPKSRYQQHPAPSEGSRGDALPCFWWLPSRSGVPCLGPASLQSLPPTSRVFPTVSLCPCVFSSSNKDPSRWIDGPP